MRSLRVRAKGKHPGKSRAISRQVARVELSRAAGWIAARRSASLGAMSGSNRGIYLACGLSVLALALGSYSWVLSAKVVERGATPSHDAESLKRELADIRAQLGAVRAQTALASDESLARLSKRLAAVEAAVGQHPGARPGSSPSSEPTDPLADEGVRDYVKFSATDPAIRVKQADDGSLSVANTNASLTGKMMFVEATRADGTVDRVPIVVPPP